MPTHWLPAVGILHSGEDQEVCEVRLLAGGGGGGGGGGVGVVVFTAGL